MKQYFVKMSLILVFRELKTEAEGLRRKISRLDTLERDVETIFCQMSLILVFRELKTEAEGLRRKISQQDTLEREMMKQYFVKMSLILRVSRELKTEKEDHPTGRPRERC